MTTVIIWNNNLAGAATYVGHASMSIDNDFGATSNSYVSWWPDGDAGPFGKMASQRNAHLLADLNTETYAPDHIIDIPALDEAAMQVAWNEIRNKANSHYSMTRKNCSSVVARVLKKGEPNVGSWSSRHHSIWTPLKVKRLALEFGGMEQSWDWLLEKCVGRLISPAERQVLATLCKRDARHGPGTTAAYYAAGKRVAPKVMLFSEARGAHRPGFQIGKPKEGAPTMFVENGSIFGGHIARGDDGDFVTVKGAP